MLLSSDDGGALVRLIAGDLAGHPGPGDTHTPITYAHATVSPGAELTVPWNPEFSAMAYVLLGQGYAGEEGRPVAEHQLVVFGPGDTLTIRAADHQEGETDALEVLLLGGLPIREPIAHYGPFVMNTREEIVAGRRRLQRRPHGHHPRHRPRLSQTSGWSGQRDGRSTPSASASRSTAWKRSR